jgi:PAS domain S-box-containing protein
MNVEDMRYQELIEEVSTLKQRISELERSQAEHRIIEKNLQESEAKYRFIAENSAEILRIADMDLRSTYVSPSVLRIRGLTVEEALQETPEAIFPPSSLQHVLSVLAEEKALAADGTADSNRVRTLEVEVFKKDGSLFWMEFSMSIVRNKSGEFCGIVTVARDISKRKQIEQELRKSEQALRTIFDNTHDAIFIHDLEGRILDCNQRMLDLYRITKEQALRSAIIDDFSMPGSSLAEQKERWSRVMKGETITFEWKARRPNDGFIFDVDVALKRIVLDECPVVLANVRDITEQKAAEAALKESEEKFRALVENCGDGIVRFDRNHRYIYVNRFVIEHTGFPLSPDDFIGKRFEEVGFPPDFCAQGHENIERGFVTGEIIRHEFQQPDGKWIDVIQIPEKDAAGEVKAVIATSHDITRLKNAEAALRESEEKFRALVENSIDGIMRIDRNHRYLYANPVMEQITGISPKEFPGKTFEDLGLPQDLCDQWHEVVEEIFNSGEVYRKEYRLPKNQWIDLIRIPEKDAAGQVKTIISVARDISANKAIEVALRDSERQFRALVENSRDAIMRIDRNHRYLYVNPIVEKQSGIPPEKYLGKTFEEVGFPRELCNRWHEMVKRIFHYGEINRMEFQFPNGMWIDQISIPEKDAAGEVKAIIAAGRDITANKQNAIMLQSLFQMAPLAICVNDGNRVTTKVNYYALKSFGYSPEEIVGRTPRFLYFSDDDYEAAGKALYSSANGTAEIRMRRKDGEAIWVLMNRSYINGKDPSGGSIVIVQDITSRKALEEQLRQAQKMEAIGQLAGGVAHDFNNILQTILGYTHMILYSLSPDDKNQRKLKEVEKAAERATALTRQLLAFSRRQVLKLVPLDMNSAVDDLLKMLRRLIGENIELNFLPDPALWAINADRSQMEQVIINLCVNARDAMQDGGRLSITTHNVPLDEEYCAQNDWAKPGRYVRLDITDSGCGIDPETRAKIFEPFFTTKEQGRGTGLGLATVYGIVRQHEGMINVYSEVGKGSLFSIYLPTAESAQEEITAEEQVPVPGGRETILLAEDDEPLRFLTTEMLKPAGYRVLVAVDGEDALRLYRDHEKEIDLLLLDVVMPRKGGRCVYDEIRAVRPDIPCLFMSGYSENAVHTNFILNQGFKLIQKPFKSNDLLKMLREVLDSSCRTASGG